MSYLLFSYAFHFDEVTESTRHWNNRKQIIREDIFQNQAKKIIYM